MSIRVTCECGKELRVKDEYAGKRGKCPSCGKILQIPQPEADVFDLKDDAPAPPPRVAAPIPKPALAARVAIAKPAPLPALTPTSSSARQYLYFVLLLAF